MLGNIVNFFPLELDLVVLKCIFYQNNANSWTHLIFLDLCSKHLESIFDVFQCFS